MMRSLKQYFGEKAETAIQYLDFTMSDEAWSKGCYAGLMSVNSWSKFQDNYRKSEDRLHFAGTEAATRWHGYIEGAVLAGEAAASKIIKNQPN
jgi:monoamine oxidase